MAKGNKEEKKSKPKRSWGLTESQKTILAQMQARHKREHHPLNAYQNEQTRMVLVEFQNELRIPKGLWDDVGFDFRTMEFSIVLRESNTTQALTKT